CTSTVDVTGKADASASSSRRMRAVVISPRAFQVLGAWNPTSGSAGWGASRGTSQKPNDTSSFGSSATNTMRARGSLAVAWWITSASCPMVGGATAGGGRVSVMEGLRMVGGSGGPAMTAQEGTAILVAPILPLGSDTQTE